MKTLLIKFLAAVLFSGLSMVEALAQNSESDKEIIIIEKTVDEEGNVISKNTKRYSGKYTEDEIQDLLEDDLPPAIRSYDLDGMGFGDLFSDRFNQRPTRPTIGVNLNFEDGMATVDRVSRGSGAEESDIRVGDQLISINGIAISTIDDIHEFLDTKQSGDQINLVIFRDGAEMEKKVILGGRNNGFFFDFPEGSLFDLLGEGNELRFDMDSSLMKRFFNREIPQQLGERRFNQDPNPLSDTRERASLGAFIDDAKANVVITDIVADSPAEQVGLQVDDIILRMDDNVVTSYIEVEHLMKSKKVGDMLKLEIDRQGKILELEVELFN